MSQALNLESAAPATVPDFGALPFALSDVGWVLLAVALMLAVVMVLGVLGSRRRRRARAKLAVQRGTPSP